MKMPETMYVKPTRDGVLLRNPATGEIIPPEGAAVTLGPYRVFWLRRIKDGDALAVATKEATDKDSNDALAVATAPATSGGARNKQAAQEE